MGGGDLNLKKSWHPSTMKNMEKVWKAEQQDHQEKKRIAELKREIEMEKDKEDMKKFAMDQGVIEKKDEKKLDWMYKGPDRSVNREEYLLGRPIDEPIEKMARADKEDGAPPKNHVEYECIPPSLRFFSGSEQVDLARKLQEDPLYAIKKKEMETKSQLLKNPVRLKQLRDLLDEKSKRDKHQKKRRKEKKCWKSSSPQGEGHRLDDLLAKKYKKLKSKIDEDYLIKSMKKLKKEEEKKKKKKKRLAKDDDGNKDYWEKSRKNSGEEERSMREEGKNGSDRSKRKDKRRKWSDSSSSSEQDNLVKLGRKMRENKKHGDCSKRKGGEYVEKNEQDEIIDSRNFGLMNADGTRIETKKLDAHHNRTSKRGSNLTSYDDKKDEKRWLPPRKKERLTEEEKEQRRREMMENASWRDRERQVNVKRYREQEKMEQTEKSYNKDFIRKQLHAAAEIGTVESRIRSNINNIQRSGGAMDRNFAKR